MRTTFGRWWFQAVAVLLLTFSSSGLTAQASDPARITGEIRDESGAPLSGVQVVIVNQQNGFQSGGLTQSNGRYLVVGLRPGGPYRIEARMIGYGLQAMDDVVLEAGGTFQADFTLGTEAIAMDALEVFATRAIERKTPVAYTDVPKVQIQNQLGSRDLPMVLNVTPSVYATQSGGGAGDARINVRGFNQRNTAVMINGVPVNDMENGWVYWSNWDGVGDAATSIQLQRGLSAVNLATPSIGGTLNVITDPTATASGLSYKQEWGLGQVNSSGDWYLFDGDGKPIRNLMKETLVFSSGPIAEKLAFTGSLVRKTGGGMYEGIGGQATWTDAWAYYFAGAYQISPKNRLEAYAVGAPQRHGQNAYKLNIGTLSHSFARSLDDYDQAALKTTANPTGRFAEAGRTWSPNVNRVSSSYQGKQYAGTGPGAGTFSRYDEDYINERENYFHKPQVNLNWYSYFGNGMTLSTVAYYSGGDGGGSGTYGSSSAAARDFTYYQAVIDWDGTIAKNLTKTNGRGYVLRNSVNNQATVGAISKLRKDFAGGLTAEVGLDWRTAEVEHYREVRDLLGLSYLDGCYYGCASDFWTDAEKKRYQKDRIDYNNTNTIDWLGAYVQAEKSTLESSYYGMFGLAGNSYTFTDHFADDPGKDGLQKLSLESGWITGFQVKGGASRNVTDEISLFANAGFVSKVPIFDAIIDDGEGVKNPDPKNEKFLSFEGGMGYRSQDRAISFDLSAYYTNWQDRTWSIFVPNLAGPGEDGLVNLLGLNQRHMGIEASGAYQPNALLRFDAAASFGSWTYLDNVTGQYKAENQSTPTQTATLYIRDLKVGDAPQSQLAYAVSVFPLEGLYARLQGRTYWNHYSEFDPISRSKAEDEGVMSWKAPGYSVFDLHTSYRIGDLVPVWKGGDVRFFANVYNLFDKIYIADAVDNSSYNGFDKDHDADDAEVYLGLPRTLNLGFEVKF